MTRTCYYKDTVRGKDLAQYRPWWKVPRWKKRAHFKKRPKEVRNLDREKMISSYFPDAHNMPWREARELVLPCGQTLGVAWGSLMKAVQSYQLAMRQHDPQAASHAASLVHAIREDMGVMDTIYPPIEDYEPDHDQVFV